MRLPRLALFALLSVCACSGAGGSGTVVQQGNVAAPLTMQSAQEALMSGAVRFELRGLANVANRTSYGTGYTHTGTVVAVGDSTLTRRAYLVLFSVKRVSGGDPDAPRRSEDYTMTLVRGGLGDLTESGGYRTSDEHWSPEVVEVTIQGAMPWVPIQGLAVKE